MHGATVRRPYLNAGIALVGASVIAVAPVAPAPPHVSLPSVRSAEVALSAATSPYGQLLEHTVTNLNDLFQQTFANGVAPLLAQVLKNQSTMITQLGQALEQSLQISNPSSFPALLQKALSELRAGNIQGASETVATGLIQAAFPFLPPLLQPLNNFVHVVDQLPTVVLGVSLGVIQPPLALVQATGQALQNVFDAATSGDPLGVVNAIINAPAVMLDGFLNGYAPTQTGGLLSPGLGTLSLLVTIRDAIVTAITPPAVAAAKTTAATDEVASAKTAAARTVTLDVTAPKTGTASTDSSSAITSAGDTETVKKGAAATDETAAKDETAGKAADSTSTEAESSNGSTGTAANDDTSAKDDNAAKDDAGAKDNTGAKGGTGSSEGAKGSDSGSASSAKDDSTAKSGDAKKDTVKKSGTAKTGKKKK